MDPQLLRTFERSARRGPIWKPPCGPERTVLGRERIKQLIPHRDPFLLIDEVTDVGFDVQAIRGRRHVRAADPVFPGHIPGRPVYPGVLQLESVGQLGLCLIQLLAAGGIEQIAGTTPIDARVVRVHTAQFHNAVYPDDRLTLVCRLLALDEYTGVCGGQILRGHTVCSFGVMEVFFAGA